MTALSARSGDGRKSTRTREDVIDALRRYERLHGPSTSASFNPSTAKWTDREDLIAVYYGPTGPWPSLNSIRGLFGTFSAAREAAGLPVNRPGPSSRRERGVHRPIRNVRVERVFVPAINHDASAERRVKVAQERALAAERRADLAVERMRRVEAERPAPVVRDRTLRVEPIIREKVVRVTDSRAEDRLRAKVKAEQVKRREVEKALRAMTRERDRALTATDASRDALADAERLRAESERDRAVKRLGLANGRVGALTAEVEMLRGRVAGLIEGAMEAELVRQADLRAEKAEARAAKAEREMAIQAAAIVGDARRLTPAEMADLRRDGPAGPAVLTAALRKLAKARMAGNGAVDPALMEIAAAAVGWRDALGPR